MILTDSDVSRLVGKEFRGWQLTRIVGKGADGIVYAAAKDAEEVAIKIFFPEALEKHGVGEEKERLELQLRLKGSKCHPYLVEIFDGGEAEELGGALFIVMELVPGSSLDKIVSQVPREAIPTLIRQLADAARFLDEQDLVHRDIKPSNIVISDDFKKLTLLDLGIVIKGTANDQEKEASGKEFVATLRYSPPEFVWRTEERSDRDAWKAVTFYQIGATLHDLIMRRPIFDGHDKPRATLYDSVRLRPPHLEATDCEQWLVHLAKCCLVKNWRERIQLVGWESFQGPTVTEGDVNHQKHLIRLRQLRADELRVLQEADKVGRPKNERVQELWDLHNKLFMEVRQFIMSTPIFPKFSATHRSHGESEYFLSFEFEKDTQLMFGEKLTVETWLKASEAFEGATALTIKATMGTGASVFEGKWTEMFTVETAALVVQQSFLQIADKVVPKGN